VAWPPELRDLSFDRRALYLAQETKERDFVFFLAFGTEENAGLGVITSNYPINVLYGFPACTLKFPWSQAQERMFCLFLYLCGATHPIPPRVTKRHVLG
jgi:hypothetical protein